MPLITPVAVFTLSPAGSPVAVKLRGVRLAVIAWLNAVPYVPAAATFPVTTGSVVVAFTE